MAVQCLFELKLLGEVFKTKEFQNIYPGNPRLFFKTVLSVIRKGSSFTWVVPKMVFGLLVYSSCFDCLSLWTSPRKPPCLTQRVSLTGGFASCLQPHGTLTPLAGCGAQLAEELPRSGGKYGSRSVGKYLRRPHTPPITTQGV